MNRQLMILEQIANRNQLEALEMMARIRRQRRRVRRVIVDRMNPFVAMDDEEFVERFRLKKETINIVIQQIQPQLDVALDRRGMLD